MTRQTHSPRRISLIICPTPPPRKRRRVGAVRFGVADRVGEHVRDLAHGVQMRLEHGTVGVELGAQAGEPAERRLVPGGPSRERSARLSSSRPWLLRLLKSGKIDAGAAAQRGRLLVDTSSRRSIGALHVKVAGDTGSAGRGAARGGRLARRSMPAQHRISLPRAVSTGGSRRGSGRPASGRCQRRRGWPRARARAARRCARRSAARPLRKRSASPTWPLRASSLAELLGHHRLPDLAGRALAEHVGGVLGQHRLDEALQHKGLELAEGIGAALAAVAGRRPSAARRDAGVAVGRLRRARGSASPAAGGVEPRPGDVALMRAAARPRRGISRARRRAPRRGRYRREG